MCLIRTDSFSIRIRHAYLLSIIALICLSLSLISGMVHIDGFVPIAAVGPSPIHTFNNNNEQKRYFQIYLPNSYYDTDTDYPVVYFLHGFGHNHMSYSGFIIMLDELIRAGIIPPIIMVKLDASVLGYLGSFYTNSLLGNFSDYVEELVGYIANKYRIETKKIVLIGHGMGAFGALHLPLMHPNLFQSTYCLFSPYTCAGHATVAHLQKQASSEVDTCFCNAPIPLRGPASYLLAAFSRAIQQEIVTGNEAIAYIKRAIHAAQTASLTFFLEAYQNDQCSLSDSQEIMTLLQEHGITCEQHIIPPREHQTDHRSPSWIPLKLIWPLCKQLLQTYPNYLSFNQYKIPSLSIYALLSVDVDPWVYTRHNQDFFNAMSRCNVPVTTVFDDIPDAVMRLYIDRKRFAIEDDNDLHRLKDCLIKIFSSKISL
jgi:predicted esterase